jgi:hypothetical protein
VIQLELHQALLRLHRGQREAREDHAPLGVEAKALGGGQPLVISGLTTGEGDYRATKQ